MEFFKQVEMMQPDVYPSSHQTVTTTFVPFSKLSVTFLRSGAQCEIVPEETDQDFEEIEEQEISSTASASASASAVDDGELERTIDRLDRIMAESSTREKEGLASLSSLSRSSSMGTNSDSTQQVVGCRRNVGAGSQEVTIVGGVGRAHFCSGARQFTCEKNPVAAAILIDPISATSQQVEITKRAILAEMAALKSSLLSEISKSRSREDELRIELANSRAATQDLQAKLSRNDTYSNNNESSSSSSSFPFQLRSQTTASTTVHAARNNNNSASATAASKGCSSRSMSSSIVGGPRKILFANANLVNRSNNRSSSRGAMMRPNLSVATRGPKQRERDWQHLQLGPPPSAPAEGFCSLRNLQAREFERDHGQQQCQYQHQNQHQHPHQQHQVMRFGGVSGNVHAPRGL